MKKTAAIVDYRISAACESALTERGFFVIKLPPFCKIGSPLSSHTDMLAAHIGDTLIMPGDYLNENPALEAILKSELQGIRLVRSTASPASPYPADAIMNVLIGNGRIYARAASACPDILSQAEQLGYELTNVNQGYPSCTVLLLDKTAVTADEGMRRALEASGIRVYTVRNGGISLPPYEYGFIGGACGVFERTVYFLGDLNSHPDAAVIREVCVTMGYDTVSLSSEGLVDLGGIIFI